MLYKEIIDIFNELLPVIAIIVVVAISYAIYDIIVNKKKIDLIKEISKLLFIIYIIMLYHVVTFQDVSYGTHNYIPFTEMFRYDIGTRLFYRNVMGNLLLFVPYGFFISYFLKLKKIYGVFLMSTALSLVIEYTQKNIGRTFDIDDVILNVAGGLLGYIAFKTLKNIKDKIGGKK